MSHFKTWKQAAEACPPVEVEVYSLDKAKYNDSGVIAPEPCLYCGEEEVSSVATNLWMVIARGWYDVVGTRGSTLILRDGQARLYEVSLP